MFAARLTFLLIVGGLALDGIRRSAAQWTFCETAAARHLRAVPLLEAKPLPAGSSISPGLSDFTEKMARAGTWPLPHSKVIQALCCQETPLLSSRSDGARDEVPAIDSAMLDEIIELRQRIGIAPVTDMLQSSPAGPAGFLEADEQELFREALRQISEGAGKTAAFRSGDDGSTFAAAGVDFRLEEKGVGGLGMLRGLLQRIAGMCRNRGPDSD